MQANLDRVYSILFFWFLKLNSDKCVVMRYGLKSCGSGKGLNLGSGYFFVGGRELRLVQSHKDLGVTVDHTLIFYIHINS